MNTDGPAPEQPITFSGRHIEERSRASDFVASLGLSLAADLEPNDISTDNFMALKVGIFDPHYGSSRAKLQAAFARFRQVPDRRLVLFFHGGLVPAARGLEGASKLLAPYSAAEAGGAYPFFTVWETGIFEVLTERWPQILQTALFGTFLKFVADKLHIPLPSGFGAGLAADALDPALLSTTEPVPIVPPAWTLEEQRAFAAEVDAHPVVQRAAALLRGSGTGIGAMSLDVVDDIRYIDPSVRHEITASQFEADLGAITMGLKLIPVIARIAKRYLEGRAHPGLCTITEELAREFYLGPIGKDIWDGMKAFVEASLGDAPDAGGTALIDELVTLLTENPDLHVTFAAHSAGAIFVTRILEELVKRPLPAAAKVDIVFFAAAITAKRFAQSIPAVAKIVRAYRSFQLAEEFEATDSILTFGQPGKPWWTVFYPSSLPYAIAGVLEDDDSDTPLVGMSRYFVSPVYERGEFATSVGAVKQFQQRFPNARVESLPDASGQPEGLRSQATTHGGFPTEELTRASTQFVFKNGL